MQRDDATTPSRGRSTFRVLLTLFVVVVGGIAAGGACVGMYVRSTPPRSLDVPRKDLAVLAPRFTPLPSQGADRRGQTYGVWVTLDDDGTATALASRDPGSGCTVAWRAELRVEGTTGVYQDPCNGNAYDRDGTRVAGTAPRGLDRHDVTVDARRVVVDLARVRLGACAAGASEDCSPAGAPVYRDTRR